MSVDVETTVQERPHVLAQVTSVLLPPVALLAGLELTYAWVPPACASGSVMPIHLAHAVLVALIVFAGVLGWREWRQAGGGDPGDGGGAQTRQRFMGLTGLLMSVLFVVVAAAQWLPPFFLPPC